MRTNFLFLNTSFRSSVVALSLSGLALLNTACGSDTESSDPETAVSNLSAQEEANVVAVRRVLELGLGEGNTDIINELVLEGYIQHNTGAADGRAGLLGFVEFLQSTGGTTVDIHRVLADGDMVALHSSYGEGDARQVAFDVFRMENGMLAEHWDALQPWVNASDTASGSTLVDGATEIVDREITEANRAVVTEFVDVVFTQGQFDRLGDYVGDTYLQHNPQAVDGLAGLEGFIDFVETSGDAVGFTSTPLIVADGNFVLAASEGFFGPAEEKPLAVFYDLFRLEDGKLVEHWDVIPTLPEDLSTIPHNNGLF